MQEISNCCNDRLLRITIAENVRGRSVRFLHVGESELPSVVCLHANQKPTRSVQAFSFSQYTNVTHTHTHKHTYNP